MSSQYLPLFVGDYLRDTLDLYTSEHGAYLLLLMAAWSNAGELPAERNKVYRLAFANSPAHRKAVDKVLERFWKPSANGSGGLLNPRLQRELVHLRALSKAKSRAGKRSAEVRWGNRAFNTADNTGGNSGSNSRGNTATNTGGNTPTVAVTNETVTSRPDQYQTSALPPTPASDSSNPSPSSSESAERARAREDDAGDGDASRVQGDHPPTGSHEGIRLVSGEWIGLSDALCTRWQNMLGETVSVPEALAKCAAHLEANPEVLGRCENGLDNYHAFIVRWLLREGRGKESHTKQAEKTAGWWSTDDATRTKAAELKLALRPGETFPELRERIRATLDIGRGKHLH